MPTSVTSCWNPCLQVAEVEVELTFLIGRVQGGTCRNRRDAQERQRHFGSIGQDDRHGGTGPDPELVEFVRHAVDEPRELPVGHFSLLGCHDRHRIGIALGVVADELVNGLGCVGGLGRP